MLINAEGCQPAATNQLWQKVRQQQSVIIVMKSNNNNAQL